MGKTLGEQITEDRIDRMAAAIRRHQMGGRFVVEWDKLPPSRKRKWLSVASTAWNAAFPPEHHQ